VEGREKLFGNSPGGTRERERALAFYVGISVRALVE
jgi:hypothetical protein